MTKETTITRGIIKKLRAMPATYCIKQHGSMYSVSGTPDILGCHQGRTFAFEVKQPGKIASAVQQLQLRLWARSGAIVGVINSYKDALDLLAEGME